MFWRFVIPFLFLAMLMPFPARTSSDCVDVGSGCVTVASAPVTAPRRPGPPNPARRLADPAPPPWRPPSRWSMAIDLSDFDDAHDVFLSVPSTAPLRCGRGHATLFLRCMDDRTALFIWHGCPMPSEGSDLQGVEMSIDGGDAVQDTWQVGGDPSTLGLWDYRPARTLAEQLLAADTLSLRYEDALGLRREMRFDIIGLNRSIVPLRLACGWPDTFE